MYSDQLAKLQNVGMQLNIPTAIISGVLAYINKLLSEPKAKRRGDIYILDIDGFFSFMDNSLYRDFMIYMCELEFNNGEVALTIVRDLLIAIQENRWRVNKSVYLAARKYSLIRFYGII